MEVQAIATAATAIANAIAETEKTDRFLAGRSPEYLAALIEERLARKQFWQPLLDLFTR